MLAGAAAITWAQERPEHEIHAAMLFNFIKYVQWPDEGTGGDFVVGVMGEDNVFNTLKAWYDGKPKGSKNMWSKNLLLLMRLLPAMWCTWVKAGARNLTTSRLPLPVSRCSRLPMAMASAKREVASTSG